MTPLLLATLYALAIWLVPDADRAVPRGLRWLPHALAQSWTARGAMGVQLWIVAFLLAFTLATFAPETWRPGFLVALTTGTAALMVHCLWHRRSVRGTRSHLPPEPSPPRQTDAAILVGPEPSLLALASASGLLRADLRDIGIEGIRVGPTRHLPDTLPPDIAVHPAWPELVEALADVHHSHLEMARRQADHMLALTARMRDLESEAFAAEAHRKDLEQQVRRLDLWLQNARQATGTPFARSFATPQAETRALIDRLRALLPADAAAPLKALETVTPA